MFPERYRYVVAFVVGGLALAACAPGGPAGERRAESGDSARSATPTQLTLALNNEPGNLISLMEGGGAGPSGVRDAVQHHLAEHDDLGQIRPQLAVELPSTSAGTWLVRPDGTMETTYRLRRDVTWHDGHPLTARDFAFALTVHQDPALPINNPSVARQVTRIDTPDEHTLVIEWAKPYPFANAITEEDLGPLPAHILREPFENDKDRFPTLPYWKSELVGTGPFRLERWEPGILLAMRAYEGFYLGKPKIDSLVFRLIPSHSTIVANLLAGSVDGTVLDTIDFNEITLVRTEWEGGGQKPTVVSLPRKFRFLGVQLRPSTTSPAEILDVRVRRGLLHAVDRQAMVETLFGGQTPIAETVFPPSDRRWDWIKDVVATHPNDSRRALELLAEVGWRRGADGQIVNRAGERVGFPIWVTGDPQGEQEMAIVADSWRRLGIAAQEFVIPTAQQRDRQMRSSFPAFEVTSNPVTFTNITLRFYSTQCPAEGNRWTGNNRGCYQTPAMDRIIDGLHGAIEEADQRRLYRDFAKQISDDLPGLPLYFKVDSAIFRSGVIGPRAVSNDTNIGWNIHEWELRTAP